MLQALLRRDDITIEISAPALASMLGTIPQLFVQANGNTYFLHKVDHSEWFAMAKAMPALRGMPQVYYPEYHLPTDTWRIYLLPRADQDYVIIIENSNGQHRQAGTAPHSSSPQGTYQGAGPSASPRDLNAITRAAFASASAAQQASAAGLNQMGAPYVSDPAWLMRRAQGLPQAQGLALPHELTLGEIIAWRVWLVRSGFLFSPHKDDKAWGIEEPFEAEDAPTDFNAAGLYAFKTERGAIEHARENNFVSSHVYGRVALWGTVIEHTQGYRAQFARPQVLVATLGKGVDLNALRQLYKLA